MQWNLIFRQAVGTIFLYFMGNNDYCFDVKVVLHNSILNKNPSVNLSRYFSPNGGN